MTDNVVNKAKIGIRWIGIGQIGIRIISMASTIVLARLLMPEDFGTIALARLVMGFILLFSSWGIDAAIIVEEKRSKQIANTAFWINFFIMLLLAIIILISSPFVKKFYDTPILQPILIWMGIGLIFQSFELVPRTLLNKELNYKYLTKINVSVEFIINSLVILLAFLGFGVWSLVIPQIIASPLRAIPFWIKTKWHPTFYIERRDIKDLMSFGKNILASELTRYVNQNTDYFLIGKILTTAKLGYYTFAYNLANWPVVNIVKIINTVALPALSKVQSDMDELKRLFLKMTRMTSIVALPIFGIMFGITHELVTLVFGEKWIPAVKPLQIIIIFGIIRSIFAPSGRIFLIKKKPQLIFYINLIQLPLLIAGVWIGIHQAEIVGVAIAVAIVLSIGGIIIMLTVSKLLQMSIADFIKVLIPGFLCSSIFVLLGWIFKRFLFSIGISQVFILLVYCTFAVSVYCLSLLIIYPALFKESLQLFAEVAGLDWPKTREQLNNIKTRFFDRTF